MAHQTLVHLRWYDNANSRSVVRNNFCYWGEVQFLVLSGRARKQEEKIDFLFLLLSKLVSLLVELY